MIDHAHTLPVTQQARELAISRGSVYYLSRPVSEADLKIMRRIDELHLELPFAGSRMLRHLLRQEGIEIGRPHVATLMRKMAIEAIYRRPSTSKPASGHKIYPYLLRKLPIIRPNQVWAMDISYISMAKDFVYLVAIVDWFSRKVLAQPPHLGQHQPRVLPFRLINKAVADGRGSLTRARNAFNSQLDGIRGMIWDFPAVQK